MAKKWSVMTSSSKKVTVEADRVELDPGAARVIFYVGDEAVASFVGVAGYHPESADVEDVPGPEPVE